MDVKDAYPGVMEDLRAMVRAGDVIALKVGRSLVGGWGGCGLMDVRWLWVFAGVVAVGF